MPKTQLSQRQQRTSPKRVLGAALALIVAFLLLASVVSLAQKYISIRSRVRGLKEEERTLMVKQEQMRKTNAYLNTPEGQEHLLREKYGVVRPGEGVVMITESTLTPNTEAPKSRVGKWWDSLVRGLGFRKE
jgi:cell division protein FtsB